MKKNDITPIILIGLVLLLIFGFGGWFGMGGMFFFGPVFMVLILLLVVWLIVTLIQNSKR